MVAMEECGAVEVVGAMEAMVVRMEEEAAPVLIVMDLELVVLMVVMEVGAEEIELRKLENLEKWERIQ